MKPPPFVRFALDLSAGEPTARLGDAELEVIDNCNDGHMIVECDHAALATVSLDDFPDSLTVQVHNSDGLGTFLSYEAEFYKGDSGPLVGTHA